MDKTTEIAHREKAERIVVAADGGPASRAALDWVIDRASRSAVEVEIVCVEETDWLPFGADESEYRRTYVDELAQAEKRLANHHGVSFVTTRLLVGQPTEELADAALLADLLVVGARAPKTATPISNHSLAVRLATQVNCPLAVIPSDWEPAPGRIVVGVDGDESSDVALDAAADEARRSGRDLLVVHAWSLPAPFPVVDAVIHATYPTLEALHRETLENAVARARARAPHIHISQFLKFGSAAKLLAEEAVGAAVLFVGTHHRGVVGKIVLGSVSHDILIALLQPIVVVPAPPMTGDSTTVPR